MAQRRFILRDNNPNKANQYKCLEYRFNNFYKEYYPICPILYLKEVLFGELNLGSFLIHLR